MKKLMYTGAALSLTALNTANAVIDPGAGKVDGSIRTDGSADVVIQGYIANALTFLYLVAVVYGLWGGFNILTAGGDEEKVKTGKTIIIQALVGIVVIFLAGTVVEWLIGSIITTGG